VSGLSYYTYYLSLALHARVDVAVILMRRLIPRRLYPGRDRVGTTITALSTASFAPTFDGFDWYAIPSVPRGLRFLRRTKPDVVILQWWSGSVLLWYLLIARVARRSGARVILEFHEELDTAEARLPVVGPLVVRGLQRLIAACSFYVVHSEWDRERLSGSLGLDPARTAVIPHGPYDPFAHSDRSGNPVREDGVTTVLFFGTIRPYKGLEHLVAAFDRLPRDGNRNWRLLVVGETWEGWTRPLDAIAESPNRDSIELVNRYARDDEVAGFFDRADIVALPYLRSSASGPLSLTTAAGLPVVVTAVGGLVEAVKEYPGAVLVEPGDVDSIAAGLVVAAGMTGIRYRDEVSWEGIADRYVELIDMCTSQESG
jgi:glycosyltransferase involved in cell wall biosynthesis